MAFAGTSWGADATQIFTFNNGTSSFSGNIGGSLTGNVLNTSGAQLNVTDLDIHTTSDGGFLNFFPNSTSNNNTAMTPIAITPGVISVNIPTQGFNSAVSGSASVTAGDNLANAIVNQLDHGVPGSDGKWDDPNNTGILNNAHFDSASGALDSALNLSATAGGSINASIPNNVTIPGVVNASPLFVDLVIKNSSTVSINFAPTQTLSLQDLTLTTTDGFNFNTPSSGNFTDYNHPIPEANGPIHPTLDLSTKGGALVTTTITGKLVSDIMGTITGSIDADAVIRLTLSGLGTINVGTFNLDNIIDGDLGGGVISLLDLDETITLEDQLLPFAIDVVHDANTDVDFDDVAAAILSGTGGFTFPINLTQPGVVVDIPSTMFEVGGQSFHVNQSGQKGTVYLDHLAANISGHLDVDLAANLNLSADLVANAFKNSAINVVPEPGSVMLMALAGVGLVAACYRRRRRK